MIYAIELYFDKKTEEKIMNLPREIAEKGISKRYLEWQIRPYITLGLFNYINIENCDKLLEELARQVKSLPAHLSSIGIFNNSKCVFLSSKYVIENYEVLHGLFCEMSIVEIVMPVKEHTAHKLQQHDVNYNCIISEEFSIK